MAYIIEIKVLEKDDKLENLEKLEKLAEDAIKQIEEKRYETDLLNKDIKRILLLGVAFKGKIIHISHKMIEL